MATIREIKRRIKSAKNISQVTAAMEMVSAVKMRRAQESALAGRAYVEELAKMVGVLASGGDIEKKSELLTMPRKVNKILLLVVAPKKGLCGALVGNLYRQVAGFIGKTKTATNLMSILSGINDGQDLSKIETSKLSVSFVTLEKKSRDIARPFGLELLADFTISGKLPSIELVRPISDFLVEQYRTGQVDCVLVAYSHFQSTIKQVPVIKQFLPVVPHNNESGEIDKRQVILFEPSVAEVLESLLVRYCESTLLQIILEANAAEHSARMVAMKNAHDNAKEIISDLTLFYNKERQSAITSELSDATSSRMAQT